MFNIIVHTHTATPTPDTCPAEYVLQIREIGDDIKAIDDLVRKNSATIREDDKHNESSRSSTDENNCSSTMDSIHVEQDLKKKCEDFTSKQVCLFIFIFINYVVMCRGFNECLKIQNGIKCH